MCGIAGIVNFNGLVESNGTIRRMTDAIAHRGPDGEGHYVSGPVALGHRRLAIIDLTDAATQPMSTEDKRFTIVYNGETYNFRELRKELEGAGHRFFSKSDTEVVLRAYVEWGAECVARFNGMFAFAIWDAKKEELFLARDRYGMKPLYYAFTENAFLFGSEQKAVITHPSFRKDIDKEALVEYFTFQNIFTDKTFFKGIRMFKAGHHATITMNCRSLGVVCYWDYNFVEPERVRDEREYVEELDRLFSAAVHRQLVSDVPVGAYLSGGMDSGSITAIAAKSLPYMKSFTCGFDLHSASGLELGFDEREKAEHMSYLFKTEHYEMILKAGDMERAMPSLAWHLEEPRVGQSYPNYYISQLASKFVKVVLAGSGGDELFGGYPWRYYTAVVNDDFEHYIDKYYLYWQRLIPNKTIHEVFAPVWGDVKHVWTRDIFRDVFRKHSEQLTRPEDYINHSLYFEAKTFLHGLLVVEDKLSMAHSLETRLPFLDNDLVDFAMKVPIGLKLRNLKEVVKINENEPGGKQNKYFARTNDGKLLLRNVMERHIPKAITDAEKKGFSAPDASWFRGESIDYVKRIIYDDGARIYGFMDKKTVQALVDEHIAGKQNRRLFIWSLLNFEWWLRRYAV